jgi:hypothetical protein
MAVPSSHLHTGASSSRMKKITENNKKQPICFFNTIVIELSRTSSFFNIKQRSNTPEP